MWIGTAVDGRHRLETESAGTMRLCLSLSRGDPLCVGSPDQRRHHHREPPPQRPRHAPVERGIYRMRSDHQFVIAWKR